jgi:putative ABC transport system substrate-binding protein
MRRRDVLAVLGAAVSWPVNAQQTKRLPTVAIVSSLPLADLMGPEPSNQPTRAFLRGLRDHGWIERQNISIERRSAEGKQEHALAIFAELAARGVDVIFLGGTSWLHSSAHAATKTVPLVAMFAGDPIAEGFVASLVRPGGNITGVTRTTGPELYGKWLELLREFEPSIARTAFLTPGETLEDIRRVARHSGVTVLPIQVNVPGDLDAAFAIVLRERADSLIVPTGPQFYFNAQRIAAFAAERRLPGLYAIRDVVEAGGLMSYGPSVLAQFRQAAKYVDQILKGAKPADLPVEQPTIFELVINAKAAKELGLPIPPRLLASADEVIE